MKQLSAVLAAIAVFACPIPDAAAKGSSGSKSSGKSHSAAPKSHSGSSKSIGPSPGTGAKSTSTTVKAHTTKDGKYVPAHKRTTPDKSFTNNYSTKGNSNPYSGKQGTRATPPGK